MEAAAKGNFCINIGEKQMGKPNLGAEDRYWFVFCKDELLLRRTADGYSVPLQKEPPVPLAEWHTVIALPELEGHPSGAVRIDAPVTGCDGLEMVGLRASFDVLPACFYAQAGKGAELLYWDGNTKFCGVCGAPMRFHTPISKRCTNCGKEVWPQLATAIIVLVRRGEEILMVHANNFRGPYYGLVAGFVETGETLEECVAREVWEETHLRVTNIRYFGSQPWPYPCGLMVGFVADYAGGEVRLQREELGDGGWFRKEALPPIPGKVSLARRLIDAWIEGRLD